MTSAIKVAADCNGATLHAKVITEAEVKQAAVRKRAPRGGFERRIWLACQNGL